MNKLPKEDEYTIGEINQKMVAESDASTGKVDFGLNFPEIDLNAETSFENSPNSQMSDEHERSVESNQAFDFWKHFLDFETPQVENSAPLDLNEREQTVSWDKNLLPQSRKIFLKSSDYVLNYVSKLWIGPKLHLQHKKIISFHHHKDIVAILGSLDRIHLIPLGNNNGQTVPFSVSILVHPLQKNVSCIQFRPNSTNEIAVGCDDGICVWTIKSFSSPSNENQMRQGRGEGRGGGGEGRGGGRGGEERGGEGRGEGGQESNVHTMQNAEMKFLKKKSSNPVTCLRWSANGRLLASASIKGPTITIWDKAYGTAFPVTKGMEGIVQIEWSKNENILFSLTHKGNLYVWETDTWESLKYIPKPPQSIPYNIQFFSSWNCLTVAYKNKNEILGLSIDAIQSKSTKFLMPFNITMDESPFPTPFSSLPTSPSPSSPIFTPPSSIPASVHPSASPSTPAPALANTSSFNLSSMEVELVSIDPSASRMAVYFKSKDKLIHEKDESNPFFGLISIFSIPKNDNKTHHIGFIKSKSKSKDVFPLGFEFSNTFSSGALLAVLWSNGHCNFYPLVFDRD